MTDDAISIHCGVWVRCAEEIQTDFAALTRMRNLMNVESKKSPSAILVPLEEAAEIKNNSVRNRNGARGASHQAQRLVILPIAPLTGLAAVVRTLTASAFFQLLCFFLFRAIFTVLVNAAHGEERVGGRFSVQYLTVVV